MFRPLQFGNKTKRYCENKPQRLWRLDVSTHRGQNCFKRKELKGERLSVPSISWQTSASLRLDGQAKPPVSVFLTKLIKLGELLLFVSLCFAGIWGGGNQGLRTAHAQRERDTKRESERDRERERDTKRVSERERERHKERVKAKEKERESKRDTNEVRQLIFHDALETFTLLIRPPVVNGLVSGLI